MLASTGVLKNAGEQESVQLTMRFGVQIARVGLQPLADESFKLEICARRGGCVRRGRRKLGEERREQYRATRLKQSLFDDTLQLTDIARPGVRAQARQGLGIDRLDFSSHFATE